VVGPDANLEIKEHRKIYDSIAVFGIDLPPARPRYIFQSLNPHRRMKESSTPLGAPSNKASAIV
jgi:hypothetical protein